MNKATSFLILGLLSGSLLTTMVFTVLASRDTGDEGVRVVKMAHVLDQSHPVHAAMEYMAERLQELSGGSVRMEIFPNGQLGTETDSIEQVQRGALAMVKTSTAPLEGFIPEMALFGLPYLFDDSEHYWEVLNGPVGKELLLKGASVGVRGLCYYDSGSRSFYTKDGPILHPDDLEGKKIRVMRSKISMDMISEMGGAPTPIPFGELYTALQQGMVDGAENNPPSVTTSRHYEVVKHYSLDEHTRIPDIILFSQQIWDTLTPQEQEWIQQAADLSVTFQRELWNIETEKALEHLRQNGVQIYTPDKAPFQQQVTSMYEPFEGTAIGDYVEQIRALR